MGEILQVGNIAVKTFLPYVNTFALILVAKVLYKIDKRLFEIELKVKGK